MTLFLIQDRHEPADCGAVFASFPRVRQPVVPPADVGLCWHGGHAIWWSVDPATAAEALGLLPYYVGERASVTRVNEIEIP